jgi:hypothetical protein
MSELNKITSDVTALRNKIMSDLNGLIKLYSELESSVTGRFREEYQKNAGSMNGLEDFYILNSHVKKNTLSAKQAHNILKRMRDVAGYDISEEEVSEKEIAELLKA